MKKNVKLLASIICRLIFPVVICSLGYLMLLTHRPFPDLSSIQHHYILGGALGAYVTGLSFMNMNTRRWSDNVYVLYWYEKLLSVLAGICSVCLFLTSAVLICMGIVLSVDDPLGLAERVAVLFRIHLALFIFVVPCLIFIWSRYRVCDGVIAFVAGKLYYPGEAFFLFPASNKSVKGLEHEFRLTINQLQLSCQDGTFTGSVELPIRMNIEAARRENIRSLSYWEWIKKAQGKIGTILSNAAPKMTMSQLHAIAGRCEIDGIMLQWDDGAVFTLKKAQ